MSQATIIFLKIVAILFLSLIANSGFKTLMQAKNNSRGHLELHILGSVNIVCFMSLIAAALADVILLISLFLGEKAG